MSKLVFEVNNGRNMVINQSSGKVFIERYGENFDLESRDCFSEGDFVMLVNLIRYMKGNKQNTVYLRDDAGNYEDFRLLD